MDKKLFYWILGGQCSICVEDDDGDDDTVAMLLRRHVMNELKELGLTYSGGYISYGMLPGKHGTRRIACVDVRTFGNNYREATAVGELLGAKKM